ncbi:MAG TPA: hypothetical protein VL027_01115 [Spongiibacteraceae bacterium]|jgi:hypothetical protein|nr:hypothetical protein [Spongiibacteraceae bacterium]HUH36520.1 hypothetical protein [Spongiibacteraceae bacterium]
MNRIVEHWELRRRRQQRRRSVLAGLGLLIAVLMVWQQVRAGAIVPALTALPVAGEAAEPAAHAACRPGRDSRAVVPVNRREASIPYGASAGAVTL